MKIAVIGAGSWGSALAIHLSRSGHDVGLWARDPGVAERLRRENENGAYLPGHPFPPSVFVTADLDEALAGVELAVVSVPSHGLRSALRAAALWLPPGVPVVSATKGLELGTLQRMSEVVAEEAGRTHPAVVLSGPSFAAEVARGRPTAVVVASADADALGAVQSHFGGRTLRVYGSADVVGVEMGGALKNVMAIAAGVVESVGLGQNALAALITRGLTEMSRLALAMGGQRETLAGLSGLGDLVLTCTGTLSRNRHVGCELGRGRPLAEILAGMKMVAEGVHTTRAALTLGERHGVELPITAQMQQVFDGKGVAAAVGELMDRPQRAEAESR
ncbi:MAG: NAD(P)H-dependent glycerol-3-phosphate dehydrogenase [Vicinamibacterales bacterium]